ncbi:MAG: hypothetical protein ACLFPV_12910 [Spirochaetaceae bacterium]
MKGLRVIVTRPMFYLAMLLLLSADSGVAQSGTEVTDRAERLLSEAEQALEYGRHVEAIELLIRGHRLGSAEARARLQELEAAMSLQPADPWIDAGGHQIQGRLLDFETGVGLDPAVLATINLGSGRAAVADMPIAFEAVSGSAALVSPVSTSEYGLANSRVLSVADPYQPLVVRARVEFTIDGRPHILENLSRDYTYRPLGRRASLLFLLVDGNEVRYTDRNIDRLASALSTEGLQFVSPAQRPDPGALLGARSPGDSNGGAGAGPAENVTVLVVAEVLTAEQVTLGDRVFDIWQAHVALSYRVLRTEDRRLLRQLAGPREQGQGSSRSGAVADALERAVGRLESSIEDNPGDFSW